jgi:MFS family permease
VSRWRLSDLSWHHTRVTTDRDPADTGPLKDHHDPLAALRFRDFRLLVIGKLVGVIGEQMLGVAVGWELYERTRSPLALGFVGLVQVIPVFLFALPAGDTADRYNRKRIVFLMEVLVVAASLGLTYLSSSAGPLPLVYGCLFFFGVARAFKDPASSALVAHAVPPEAFPNAATWNSGAWQLATVMGPALGGLVIGVTHSATPVYALNAVAAAVYVALIAATRIETPSVEREPMSLRSFAAGAEFVWKTKIILAAITLDLFAVLLGGVTALLPIFAKDILGVGPAALGWLRAAPAAGAIVSAAVIAARPPFQKAGKTLLWAVAGFGAATIVFGLSRSFALSLAMLALLGSLDQISVVIRGTLMLVQTPDALRGRVAAVHNVFVGASNELGEFESGVAAAFLGPVLAVAAGGVGTLLVVILAAMIWPEVRRFGKLNEQPAS